MLFHRIVHKMLKMLKLLNIRLATAMIECIACIASGNCDAQLMPPPNVADNASSQLSSDAPTDVNSPDVPTVVGSQDAPTEADLMQVDAATSQESIEGVL